MPDTEIDRAMRVGNPTDLGEEIRTSAEFVKAIQEILDAGECSVPHDPGVGLVLQRLKSVVVGDYTAWVCAAN